MAVVLVASAGVAYATHEPGEEGLVHLCHHVRTGVTRLVQDPAQCTSNENVTDVASYEKAIAPPEARSRFLEEAEVPDITEEDELTPDVMLEFDLPPGHWFGSGQGVFSNEGPGAAHVTCAYLEFPDGASGFSDFKIEPFDSDVVPFSWVLEAVSDPAQNLRLGCSAERDPEDPPVSVVLRDLSLTFTRVTAFCEPPCEAG